MRNSESPFPILWLLALSFAAGVAITGNKTAQLACLILGVPVLLAVLLAAFYLLADWAERRKRQQQREENKRQEAELRAENERLKKLLTSKFVCSECHCISIPPFEPSDLEGGPQAAREHQSELD